MNLTVFLTYEWVCKVKEAVIQLELPKSYYEYMSNTCLMFMRSSCYIYKY